MKRTNPLRFLLSDRQSRWPVVLLLTTAIGMLALCLATELRANPVTWKRIQADIAKEFPQVRSIGTAELAAKIAGQPPSDFVLLDVRAHAEYAVSRIPGAIWGGPLEARAAALAKIDETTPVIVYCSVGWRSAKVVTELQSTGSRPVFNLDGSIFRWANEGRPLERDGNPVRGVHPYDAKWGVLLDARLHEERP